MKLWTLADAEAALPLAQELLAVARSAESEWRDAKEQLEDLVAVSDGAAKEPGHPDHAQWTLWKGRLDAHHVRFHNALAAFDEAGIQLKDLVMGLIDFPAQKGKEIVLLCWREGEPRIGFWHGMDTGFGSRKPIPDSVVTA